MSPLLALNRTSQSDNFRCRAKTTARDLPLSLRGSGGALVSYGYDEYESYPRSAEYIDRILKGENPRNLPVQAPTKFVLVINLKTAKALGLTVPLHLQQIADEIIE
jgi:putative ABC transport system substrate-binding protein